MNCRCDRERVVTSYLFVYPHRFSLFFFLFFCSSRYSQNANLDFPYCFNASRADTRIVYNMHSARLSVSLIIIIIIMFLINHSEIAHSSYSKQPTRTHASNYLLFSLRRRPHSTALHRGTALQFRKRTYTRIYNIAILKP